jgi:hypothetical protein
MDALSSARIGESGEAAIGISIAPLDVVMAQVSEVQPIGKTETLALARPNRLADPAYLAQKVGQNILNFLASFATPGNPTVIVRMTDLQVWYEKFVGKIKQLGPDFLDREG